MKKLKKTKNKKKVQKSVRYRPPTPVISSNGEKKSRHSGKNSEKKKPQVNNYMRDNYTKKKLNERIKIDGYTPKYNK